MARYNDGFAKMELQTIATAFDNGTMTVSTAKSRVFGYLGIDIKARTKKGFLKELANYVYSEPKQNPAKRKKYLVTADAIPGKYYSTLTGATKYFNGFAANMNPSITDMERLNSEDGDYIVAAKGRMAFGVVKKNPAPKRKTSARTQSAAEAYVRRPSQTTKKAPSARLKKRRTINLQTPRGVFPNPVRPKIAKVKVMAQSIGQKWRVIAEFPNTPKGTSDALEYAKAYHVKKPSIAIKVEK